MSSPTARALWIVRRGRWKASPGSVMMRSHSSASLAISSGSYVLHLGSLAASAFAARVAAGSHGSDDDNEGGGAGCSRSRQ